MSEETADSLASPEIEEQIEPESQNITSEMGSSEDKDLESISEKGSKNPGATNMARIYGKKLGFIVFLFDFLKSFIPWSLSPNNISWHLRQISLY